MSSEISLKARARTSDTERGWLATEGSVGVVSGGIAGGATEEVDAAVTAVVDPLGA